MLKKIIKYAIGILIPVGVGLMSAFFTKDNMNIYQSIVKPALAPPGILFPIAWTILYILMGVGSTMIYMSDSDKKNKALLIYGIQLAVNFFWTIFFFNMQAFLFSFIWLILLWCLVLIMIFRFWEVNRSAAWLQLPYLLWVTFAGYLNLMIFLLNR